MSFFSRKKQQPAAAPPANVAVAQTPSQALAQLSNSNRDLGFQPGSLRGDNPMTQYVETIPLTHSVLFKYLLDLQVVLYPYNNHSPYDLKTEITPQILVYSPPIPSNPSSNNYLNSNNSNNNNLVNQLSPGPLADLYSFLQTCLASLPPLLLLHLLLIHSLDTAMLYQQMPVLMENSIFSVVWFENLREMMFTSSQRGTTLPVYCRLPDSSQVRGWAMQVPSSGMP